MKREYYTFKTKEEAEEFRTNLNPVKYTTYPPKLQNYNEHSYWEVRVFVWGV